MRTAMKRALAFGLGVLVLGGFTSCHHVRVVGVVDDGYPPPAYVATATPVYYEGYPTYWYGGRWYRRQGAGWHHYREEPPHLREYRVRGMPPQHFYGRGHVGGGHRHR